MTQTAFSEGSPVRNSLTRMDDPRILAIHDIECGQPLIPIELSPRLLLPSSLHTQVYGIHDSQCLLVRDEVLTKLRVALTNLPEKYGFVLIEGYRGYDTQKQLLIDEMARLSLLEHRVTEEQLRNIASRFVSDPDVYSPHVTGGALDLAIVDRETGDYLDMGNVFERNASAAMEYPDLTEEQIANRKLLSDAMTAAGFVNYPTEWWHWSYGDKLWAYVTGNNAAIYGPIKLE